MYTGAEYVKFYCDDLGKEVTIKEYLKKLLKQLWLEGEGFSGKRPFGNSGWQYDLYKPLIQNNFVTGKLDEDGYIDTVDEVKADKIILKIIEGL